MRMNIMFCATNGAVVEEDHFTKRDWDKTKLSIVKAWWFLFYWPP